ncbi:MAG: hypothetical protein Q8862_09925 [Bacteroidota bacterium]|nr:hypothetical protein [Bacteroidota bacterium]MDP4206210.1 hypothetical protein [Bacteroidota bacterium]
MLQFQDDIFRLRERIQKHEETEHAQVEQLEQKVNELELQLDQLQKKVEELIRLVDSKE